VPHDAARAEHEADPRHAALVYTPVHRLPRAADGAPEARSQHPAEASLGTCDVAAARPKPRKRAALPLRRTPRLS